MTLFTIVDYLKYNKIINNIELNDTEEDYKIEKTHQYHDKIFKKILDDKEELVKFLKNYINKSKEPKIEIKEEEIEKYNRNFITENFKIKEADIIYKIKNKNVFIIVEHQSKIDYRMAERMLQYCVEIIRSVKKKNNENYPLICPIVLYTGSKKWDSALTISQIQEEYYGFPPLDYPKYNLIDINDYTKEELLEEKSSISKAMIFEKIKTKEEFIETLKSIIKKGLDREERKYIITMLKYSNDIRGKLTKEEIKESLNKLEEGVGNMTKFEKFFIEVLDDKYKEGEIKGEVRGQAIGRKQTTTKMIIEMLKNNINENTIKKVAGIDDKELQEIKDSI